MRLAFADPPYPGHAHLYRDHPDYGGEVDHARLIYQLVSEYDGYCLCTSAEALPMVLGRFQIETNEMPRILAWVKHTITVSWEPVLVRSARPPAGVPRDWLQCEPDSYQWRAKPDSYVIGQKPEPFCRWVFQWLGADPDDELYDLFPGSWSVARAWQRWKQEPELPLLARSPSAQGRAERRARAALEHPQLDGV